MSDKISEHWMKILLVVLIFAIVLVFSGLSSISISKFVLHNTLIVGGFYLLYFCGCATLDSALWSAGWWLATNFFFMSLYVLGYGVSW